MAPSGAEIWWEEAGHRRRARCEKRRPAENLLCTLRTPDIKLPFLGGSRRDVRGRFSACYCLPRSLPLLLRTVRVGLDGDDFSPVDQAINDAYKRMRRWQKPRSTEQKVYW